MTTPFPIETWTKPGRDAFEFWISFFPTAPLFGVEWRFAAIADPVANPFLMPGIVPGMPGMRAAAAASHPGELDSPAAADEEAANPVTRTADLLGDAARDMTRVATETGRAAARTADAALKTGADAAKQAMDAQSRAVDVAEETGKTARRSAETAMTAAEDAVTTAQIATEETARKAQNGAAKAAETTGKAAEATGKAAAEVTGKAAEATGKAVGKGAGRTAETVDKAVAAAPKPKMLLDKKPDQVDDLKAIKGIGPDLERQLNRLGLYRFDQLAKMSDTDVAWIDANITRFKGRCYRDDWVGQAKARLSK